MCGLEIESILPFKTYAICDLLLLIQALEASVGMRDWLERELGEDHPVYARYAQ